MGKDSADNAHGDVGFIAMEEIAQNIHLLSETTLQKIGRGALVKFIQACHDIDKARKVFESLWETFSTASISNSHSTEVCNALSAFLTTAFVSKYEPIRCLVRSEETWVRVFESFLNRYKDTRPKPMKKVLESLMMILSKTRQEHIGQSIQRKAVNAVIPSIILGEPRARLKASIVAIEMSVRKQAILPIELISLVQDWLLCNREQWPSVLQEECKDSRIDTAQFLNGSSESELSDINLKRTAAEILVLGFLTRAKVIEFAASCGEALTIVFQRLQISPDSTEPSHENGQQLSSVWVKPVKYFMLKNLDMLEKLSNYILHHLFSVDPSGFLSFIESLPLRGLLVGDMINSPSDELTLLFTSLQIGKKIGRVHEDHYLSKSSTSNEKENVLILKSEFIGQFLFHCDIHIRMAALALLVMAPSTTKPVTPAAIKVIIKGLPSLHAESDPGSRGEILSLIRKLLVRLKSSVFGEQSHQTEQEIAINKKQPPNFFKDDTETKAYLKEYLEFLTTDLRPTASYNRHIMALKTILLLLESGLDERFTTTLPSRFEGFYTKWKFHLEIFEPVLLRLLLDLLPDPYDEVRATSLVILQMFPQSVLLAPSKLTEETPEMIKALTKAENLASNTSRADHADAVARLYHVIFSAANQSDPEGDANWWETKAGVVEAIISKLEEKLSASEGLFNSTMRDAPLHGYLSALRYIVSTPNFYSVISNNNRAPYDEWKSVHRRMLFICDRIWAEVKPVLCIDSPEGHAADPIEDLIVGPKDILSYSWRALREFSYLLNATLANETYGPEGDFGLTREDYKKIGKSSFTQLAELRHRGAFSTVAQTFATCCQRCGQSNNPEISALPLLWYEEAKQFIYESASKLTRRSAGLPAMLVGILLSNPGGSFFNQVLQELQDISHLPAQHDNNKQASELPQVHAINCLKDIFTNAKLGPYTESFIMSALNLSAERIGSPIWALRNSGLMLFRGLLVRMCRNDFQGFGGGSGSEPGARISFPKYPGLIPLLSGLLNTQDQRIRTERSDSAMVTERVFPALELIAEKIPNTSEVDDEMLRGLVREHLKSPVWGIREHAARVYASLLNRSDILTGVETLLHKRDSTTENYLHGETLCIKYSLRRFTYTPSALWNEQISGILSTVQSVFAASFPLTQSPFVATALLEILSDTVEKSVETGAEAQMIQTLDQLFDTYGFLDILEFVFDSTHPSWKTLSTTRAFSLLRREASWIVLLQKLIRHETADLAPFFHRISDFDSNASQWLLDRIYNTFEVKGHYRQTTMDLYASVIIGNYPAEAKIAAISHLASNLEFILDIRGTQIPEVKLDWIRLNEQVRIHSTQKGFNRDRSDATLRLQGCLLAANFIFGEQETLGKEVAEWATRLRFAMQEETEFTTRYAAATSIAAFAGVLRPSGKPPRVDRIFLEIYLSLYDLLNDDDEELRDISALTASWTLSYSSVSSEKAVTLSALNASQLFASFLADNYSDSSLLCSRIIRYILGQEPRLGDSDCKAGPISVSYIVSELRKESTILFEEEKQNLFIEEVREIDVWSRALTQFGGEAFNEDLVREIFNWVFEGLTCFSETLSDPLGEDGPIGWVSKPEAYTLAVRVIELANVLISREFSAGNLLGDGQVLLKEKLQLLLSSAKASLLHDDLVSRIQLGLGNAQSNPKDLIKGLMLNVSKRVDNAVPGSPKVEGAFHEPHGARVGDLQLGPRSIK